MAAVPAKPIFCTPTTAPVGTIDLVANLKPLECVSFGTDMSEVYVQIIRDEDEEGWTVDLQPSDWWNFHSRESMFRNCPMVLQECIANTPLKHCDDADSPEAAVIKMLTLLAYIHPTAAVRLEDRWQC